MKKDETLLTHQSSSLSHITYNLNHSMNFDNDDPSTEIQREDEPVKIITTGQPAPQQHPSASFFKNLSLFRVNTGLYIRGHLFHTNFCAQMTSFVFVFCMIWVLVT